LAIIFGKDMEATLPRALDSIVAQSVAPSQIVVVDDGSIDSTPDILRKFRAAHQDNLHSLTFSHARYDLRRIPLLLNAALEFVEKSRFLYDYVLIGADDDIYPRNYAEFLMSAMEKDRRVVIASGEIKGVRTRRSRNPAPEGGGRMINAQFLYKTGNRFPTFYGYESWILYKALQLGYKLAKYSQVKISHARRLGAVHGFREWGVAMACADFLAPYVLFLTAYNILLNPRIIPAGASLRIALDYLRSLRRTSREGDWAFKKWRDCDPAVVSWIRLYQARMLLRIFTKPFRMLSDGVRRVAK
jgi:glycosyltransferase involved in cell wall biosynthesis